MTDHPEEPTQETAASRLAAQVPPSLRQMVSFSKDELDTMVANAKIWLKDPQALRDQVRLDTLVIYQVFRKVALNPPGGRLGANTAAKAAQQVVHMAQKLIDAELKQAERDDEPARCTFRCSCGPGPNHSDTCKAWPEENAQADHEPVDQPVKPEPDKPAAGRPRKKRAS